MAATRCKCGKKKLPQSPWCQSCGQRNRAKTEKKHGHCPVCGFYIGNNRAPGRKEVVCVYCLNPVPKEAKSKHRRSEAVWVNVKVA
jgi:hypothetical protein